MKSSFLLLALLVISSQSTYAKESRFEVTSDVSLSCVKRATQEKNFFKLDIFKTLENCRNQPAEGVNCVALSTKDNEACSNYVLENVAKKFFDRDKEELQKECQTITYACKPQD